MFDTLESGIGLDVILWLQDNRTGWLAVLSEILNELGADIGYIAILGLIYWTINKREGLRLLFALVMIALVTFILKDTLLRPRPFQAFPDVVMPVFEASGYGLPSGHTSFAVMVWGYIALWQRKAWLWAFAIFYMLLQGAGRMIAGVHYPQDVLLGIIIGVLTLAVYIRVLDRYTRFWHTQSLPVQLAIAAGVPLIMSIVVLILPLQPHQIEVYMTMFGLALGAGIGTIVEARMVKFVPHDEGSRQAGIFLLGLIVSLLVVVGLSPLFDLIAENGSIAHLLRLLRYGTAGFVAIAIVPLIGTHFSLMYNEDSLKTQPETS